MVFLKFSLYEGAKRINYPMWSGTELMMKIAAEVSKTYFYSFLQEEKCLFFHEPVLSKRY